jgi:caffeoyl-CoA O-methyltransferase
VEDGVSYRPLPLTEDLHAYMVAHGTPPDEVTSDLIAETRASLPDDAGMQVAPEQAAFLRMLTGLIGVRNAVEVGTFTGLSSLSIARGLADGGRLICFDISAEFTGVARRYWRRAGVDDRIELRIGPAADTLTALPTEPHLDLAFVDADKPGYPTYWDELVPRLRPGGVILVDNVLWSGRVLDPQSESDHAVAAFNDKVLADDRVDVVMLPIADGLTLARRR